MFLKIYFFIRLKIPNYTGYRFIVPGYPKYIFGKGDEINMKKLFWKCFFETGKIDMYLLYKEYEKEEKTKQIYQIDDQTQSFQSSNHRKGWIG
ncbi:YqzL-like protein [Garciella nitratireducens DSM 15102]|uniref:YqzL-like protein n=2 Tax=Garciella TaxID=218204 RepID=A0A1T4JRR6_9FIRM|nr:YqzL-like protein [Garciella nitratireducens DSM 15102]